MTRPLSIAVAGLGTVGAGVVTLLRQNADIVAARAGRPIVVTAVSARDRSRDRGIALEGLRWYDDPVALAFGRPVNFADLHVEGIRNVSAVDIAFASELGYRIKLLGIARRTEAGISARVHPCMVPQSAPIARVDGVFNAVVAEGDFVGRVMLEGRGAGAGPTASAVVADLIDIARNRHTPVWGVGADALSHAPAVPMSAHTGCYYLRLMVVDRPGVIADVTAVLRDVGVSLESMLQRGRSPGEAVPVVLVTHETGEAAMRTALTRIAALDAVMEEPALIRIEPA